LDELPGSDILREGLDDLARGRDSVPGLLLRIAEPRLAQLGIPLPARARVPDVADEILLYRMLRSAGSLDAYGEYNAWLRRLASLCHALELRARL
jgi:hypothetical protein